MKKQNPQYAMFGMPGGAEWIVILVVMAISLAPFIIAGAILIRVFRHFREADTERRRLRIEVAKLGHELEQIRKDRQ